MAKLRVGYTKGKKTKNKIIEKEILEVNHGYKYSQLRAMIKDKTGFTGKIHICYATPLRKRVA